MLEVQAGFAYLQPGIVRRTTARGSGDWLVVTLWDSEAAARAAAGAARSDPAASAFSSLVEIVDIRRYETLD